VAKAFQPSTRALALVLARLVHEARERAALHSIHREIGMAVHLPHVVHADDIGMAELLRISRRVSPAANSITR